MKIEQKNIQQTAGTTYYELELEVNKKKVVVSMWFSHDRDIGETDRGFEIVEGDLTDGEREAVEDFINDDKIDWSEK